MVLLVYDNVGPTILDALTTKLLSAKNNHPGSIKNTT
jgi:hypothetical protein